MPILSSDHAALAHRWSRGFPAAMPDTGEGELDPAGRRQRIRAAVRRLTDAGDDCGRVIAKAEESPSAVEEAGGLRFERHLLSRGTAGPFAVILTLPCDLAGPVPAVVVCPGRNAVPEQVAGQQAPDYPDRDVAGQLSRAGFIAATLVYDLDGALDPAVLGGRDEASVLAQVHAVAGRPLVGVLAQDALAVAGWLAGHPAVQADRIGMFGHSLGAAVALYAGLLADRARPLCLASYLGTFATLALGSAPAMLPGIGRHADLPDLIGALAPAPLQVQYGLADATLDPRDAARAGEMVTRAYRALGAGGQAEVAAVPMGHGTDVPLAIGFLRDALGAHTPLPGAPVPPARPYFDQAMRREVADAVDQVLASGMLTLADLVRRFERELAPWTGGTPVTVSSGSAALEMILRHLHVAGQTVLVPVNTFFATAASALRAGAQVDFVDLEPVGLGLSPASLLERLDRHAGQVGAVIVMHTGGIIAPGLSQVLGICRARGIPVVEDAAHALGSALAGTRAGSIADFGAFSFYPTKVLTSGEGGAVVAADERHTDELRRVRDHGRTSRSATLHDLLGTNWRLSELHAAVGLAQVRRFAEHVAMRASAAARYDHLLHDFPAGVPYALPPGVTTSWYKYIVLLKAPIGDRAALRTRMRAQGGSLAGEVYDVLLCDQPYFRDHPAGQGAADPGAFPAAGDFAARHICLPIYPGITAADQELVVRALCQAVA